MKCKAKKCIKLLFQVYISRGPLDPPPLLMGGNPPDLVVSPQHLRSGNNVNFTKINSALKDIFCI